MHRPPVVRNPGGFGGRRASSATSPRTFTYGPQQGGMLYNTPDVAQHCCTRLLYKIRCCTRMLYMTAEMDIAHVRRFLGNLVSSLAEGEMDEIVITRYRKPMARLVGLKTPPQPPAEKAGVPVSPGPKAPPTATAVEAPVAQRTEHLASDERVEGSSPSGRARTWTERNPQQAQRDAMLNRMRTKK
jgi:hypothetical protein